MSSRTRQLLICWLAGSALLAAIMLYFIVKPPGRTTLLALASLVALSAFFLLAIYRVEAALLALFCYMSVDGFLRLYFNYNPIIHLAIDGLIVSLLVAQLCRSVCLRTPHLHRTPLDLPLWAFFAVAAVNVFNPRSTPIVGLFGMKLHFEAVPLFYFAYFLIDTVDKRRLFVTWFTWISVFVCGFAIVQYATGPEVWSSLGPAFAEKIAQQTWWDASGHTFFRPLSTTLSGSWPGLYCLLVCWPFIGLLMDRCRRPPPWAPVILGVCLASLFISTFRGGWAALLLASVLFLSLRWSPLVGVSLVLLGAVVLTKLPAAPPSKETGFDAKISTLQNPMQAYMRERGFYITELLPLVFRETPLGAGTGTTTPAAIYAREMVGASTHAWESHVYFVQMAIEMGIPGFVVILWLCGQMIHISFKAAVQAAGDEDASLLNGLAVTVAAVMATGFVGPVLVGSFPSSYLWFYCGMLSRSLEERSHPPHLAVHPEVAA